jgi:hypothetical protein
VREAAISVSDIKAIDSATVVCNHLGAADDHPTTLMGDLAAPAITVRTGLSDGDAHEMVGIVLAIEYCHH